MDAWTGLDWTTSAGKLESFSTVKAISQSLRLCHCSCEPVQRLHLSSVVRPA